MTVSIMSLHQRRLFRVIALSLILASTLTALVSASEQQCTFVKTASLSPSRASSEDGEACTTAQSLQPALTSMPPSLQRNSTDQQFSFEMFVGMTRNGMYRAATSASPLGSKLVIPRTYMVLLLM